MRNFGDSGRANVRPPVFEWGFAPACRFRARARTRGRRHARPESCAMRLHVSASVIRWNSNFATVISASNLPRARSATSIYLGLVLIVTAINLLGGMTPRRRRRSCSRLSAAHRGRLPRVDPDSRATYLRPLRHRYQLIARHRRHRDGSVRHDDQRLAAAAGSTAIPDGRRARDRLRHAVPRSAVPVVVVVGSASSSAFAAIGARARRPRRTICLRGVRAGCDRADGRAVRRRAWSSSRAPTSSRRSS